VNFFKNILATVDLGDQESSKMVMNAALELLDKGDMLNVVCVVPDYGMSVVGSFFPEGHEHEAISKATEALHAFTAENVPKGQKVQHIIGHGNVYEEIIDAAEKVDADVIVIGSHRPKLRDYLLGPNAARVVRHSTRSVVVVRGKK
jgi:nucleotide-binding universal stress UspA family protein